jgi:signal transduction histidine kinase/ligand-binding sensor domain-containing protein
MKWLAAFAAAVCLAGNVWALAPEFSLQELNLRTWNVKDGAPGGVSFAQTKDGVMWVAGPSGLFKFDGMTFVRYVGTGGTSLQAGNVSTLFASSDGGLWIGFLFGGIDVLRDGQVTHFKASDGIPGGTVRGISQDRSGAVWIATNRGVGRFDTHRWEVVGDAWGVPSSPANGIVLDHEGSVWVRTYVATLKLTPGSHVFRTMGTYPPADTGPNPMAVAADGAVWVCDTLDTLVRYPPGTGTTQADKILTSAQALVADSDGSMWFGTGYEYEGGIRRIRPSKKSSERDGNWIVESFSKKDGLTGGYVTQLFEDREGNIFVATAQGINRFNVGRVVPLLLPVVGTYAIVAGEGGSVWVANTGGEQSSLMRLVGGRLASREKITTHITCGYRDPDGSVWLGGYDDILHVSQGRRTVVSRPEKLRSSAVQTMVRDRDGTLWVGFQGKEIGLYRMSGDDWVRFAPSTTGPEATPLVSARGTDGRLWFGFASGRVMMLDAGVAHWYGPKEGVSVGVVSAMYAGSTGLWVGGERGLARLVADHFVPVVARAGTSFPSISGIAEDTSGDLWLASADSVLHVTAAELARIQADPSYAAGVTSLDFRDGLPGTPRQLRPNPSLITDETGRIWLTLESGLVWIDPSNATRANGAAPPVTIERLVLDNVSVPKTANVQAIPGGFNTLEIGYDAWSLSFPERTRFRYRLEGFDKDWADAGSRREAIFTNVPPGTYRFRVIAATESGPWSESGATLDLKIAASFYQRAWFQLGCVALSLLALVIFYRIQQRRLSARLRARLEERMIERERIARELHDTLLQGIQGLILRFHAATQRLASEDPVRVSMQQALEQAEETLVEGRERVQNLRNSSGEAHDVVADLVEIGNKLSSEQGIAIDWSVTGDERPLHTIVREETFVLGREALLNAFAHSKAKTISIEASYGTSEFRLAISDDGRGIDLDLIEGNRAGHWGLRGMRERAATMRASLQIRRIPTGGTEVCLRVPAEVAYLTRRGNRWSFRAGRR